MCCKGEKGISAATKDVSDSTLDLASFIGRSFKMSEVDKSGGWNLRSLEEERFGKRLELFFKFTRVWQLFLFSADKDDEKLISEGT